MNRTGLLIALGVAAVSIAAFALFPRLDVVVSSAFYDPATRVFPLSFSRFAAFLRDCAMWLTWAFVVPSIVAFLAKLIWPDKPLLISGRTVAFFLISFTLASGVLSNLAFKGHWGRPRPVSVTEFNGPWQFKPWWDSSGACPKNCSFFSGEASTAFWTYAPAALTPPQWRPVAFAAATAFGALTGLLRITFGGHFLSDVIAAGVVTFLTVWLCYALIYRWRPTRLSDLQVDDALTRAFWPLFRWRRRMSANLGRPRRTLPQRIVEAPHDE